jgi:hypothetical protein
MFKKFVFAFLFFVCAASISNAGEIHLRLFAPSEVNIPFYTSRFDKYYLGPYYKQDLVGPYYDYRVGEYYRPYYHSPHYHGPYFHHRFERNNFRISIFK